MSAIFRRIYGKVRLLNGLQSTLNLSIVCIKGNLRWRLSKSYLNCDATRLRRPITSDNCAESFVGYSNEMTIWAKQQKPADRSVKFNSTCRRMDFERWLTLASESRYTPSQVFIPKANTRNSIKAHKLIKHWIRIAENDRLAVHQSQKADRNRKQRL